MKNLEYSNWLNKIKKSWEEKDFDLLSSILSDTLAWYESPFKDCLTTKEQVIEQWKKDLKLQHDIHFDFKILVETKDGCVANWTASFTDGSNSFDMDGIFYIELNNEGKSTIFKQWYVVK